MNTLPNKLEDLAAVKGPSRIKQRRKLPPPSFNSLTPEKCPTDDSNLHQGRIRSRPHVDGDWPTHIYIPINLQPRTAEFLSQTVEKIAQEDSSRAWHLLTEKNAGNYSLHLSISRPVFLKTNERDGFIEELKKSIREIDMFEINFSNFAVLINDEQTRGFLALEVGSGHLFLQNLLESIDKVMEIYFQPKYYEKPKFHVSICWCLLKQENPSRYASTNELISKTFLENLNSVKLDCVRKLSWKIDSFNVIIGRDTHKVTLNGLF